MPLGLADGWCDYTLIYRLLAEEDTSTIQFAQLCFLVLTWLIGAIPAALAATDETDDLPEWELGVGVAAYKSSRLPWLR